LRTQDNALVPVLVDFVEIEAKLPEFWTSDCHLMQIGRVKAFGCNLAVDTSVDNEEIREFFVLVYGTLDSDLGAVTALCLWSCCMP
jgi:hypothetical protein